LGTAIAKHLVELMGGVIGVESEENKGSRFWFQIPLNGSARKSNALYGVKTGHPLCCFVTKDAARGKLFSSTPGLQSGERYDVIFKDWRTLEISDVRLDECCVIMDCQDVSDRELADIVMDAQKAGTCLVACDSESQRHDLYLRTGFHMVMDSFEYIDNVLLYASLVLDSCTHVLQREDVGWYQKDGNTSRVLVADDCKLNRHVMRAMLGELGIESDFASSGPMTLEKLQAETYDLLVLDIQMPGMSGFDVIEAYQEVQSDEEQIPIMVITGDATSEIHDECDRLGVASFLLKPVDQEMLRNALASLISPAGAQYSPGIA
jgi:two-component system sensor histidine kinase RpfC